MKPIKNQDSSTTTDLTPQCIHCGLCLQSCPTYVELGKEADSPRGRIYLMQAQQQGKLDIQGSFAQHISSCLDCRACESACPSGVPYGQLIENARELVEKQLHRPWPVRMLRRYIFEFVFSSPRKLRFHFDLLRLYQRTGLQKLVRSSGLLKLFPGHFSKLEQLLPDLTLKNNRIKIGSIFKPKVSVHHRVGLLTGCVMNELFGSIHRATIRVLQLNGCEVVVPKSQVCCAALHSHAGIASTAKQMAKKNIEAFEKAGVDKIIVNAAGCGAKLKEYGSLLEQDPEFQFRAQTFSKKVVDISEFLYDLPEFLPPGPLRTRVAYDDPCHLLHAQRIAQAPRALLKRIPELQLVELKNPDQCCGSAGIYNVTEYDLSMRILKRKVEDIENCSPTILATGNAGCLIQISYGLNMANLPKIRVMHPIEILDQAYRSSTKS